MPQIPKKDHIPALIKVGQAFGGHLRYSSSSGGAFLRMGTPPYHVDIHKGDSIVKKGGQAIVTQFYMKRKIAYLKKYPELRHLVDEAEAHLKKSIKLEKR